LRSRKPQISVCYVKRTFCGEQRICRASFDGTFHSARSITICPCELTRKQRSRATTAKIARLFHNCCSA
jgi:hypothetical protein